MAIAYNTSIIKDGLVLCLDAANPKSYPGVLGAELVTTSTVTQIDGTTFNVVRDAGQNIALNLCTVETGKTYYVDYLITSYTGTVGASFRVNNSGGNITPTSGVNSAGRFNVKFTANATGTLSITGDNSGTNFLVDYVSVKEVLSGTDTRWFDLSGAGNNGTLTNGPTYNTSNNGYIVFDGTDDNISVTSNTNTRLANPVQTISAMCYITSVGPNGYAELYIAHNNGYHVIKWEPTAITLGLSGDFYTNTIAMTNAYNTWMEITCIIDWSTLQFQVYKNGAFVNSRAITIGTHVFTNPNLVSIGGNRATGNSSDYLKGRISSVKVYNRALTATEIRQNFEALRGRYGI